MNIVKKIQANIRRVKRVYQIELDKKTREIVSMKRQFDRKNKVHRELQAKYARLYSKHYKQQKKIESLQMTLKVIGDSMKTLTVTEKVSPVRISDAVMIDRQWNPSKEELANDEQADGKSSAMLNREDTV